MRKRLAYVDRYQTNTKIIFNFFRFLLHELYDLDREIKFVPCEMIDNNDNTNKNKIVIIILTIIIVHEAILCPACIHQIIYEKERSILISCQVERFAICILCNCSFIVPILDFTFQVPLSAASAHGSPIRGKKNMKLLK